MTISELEAWLLPWEDAWQNVPESARDPEDTKVAAAIRALIADWRRMRELLRDIANGGCSGDGYLALQVICKLKCQE